MRDWAECVPNFSEGRAAKCLDRLEEAVRAARVNLLDRHSDADHHRSVFTFAGEFNSIRQAVLASAAVAVEEVDLRCHRGKHPRVGALDVVPLVPLGETRRSACLDLARDLGDRLWSELRVPVYYYGSAAAQSGRSKLEAVRNLGFEKLSTLARSGEVRPDVGGPALHPSAGACCIGVRDYLVAFNVQLAGQDDRAARQIARSIRESSGGLPGCQGLGDIPRIRWRGTGLNEPHDARTHAGLCSV